MSQQIEGAEITIYSEDGYSVIYELDEETLAVILKAIGFKYLGNGEVTQYGPQTLNKILNGELNPFKLKEV